MSGRDLGRWGFVLCCATELKWFTIREQRQMGWKQEAVMPAKCQMAQAVSVSNSSAMSRSHQPLCLDKWSRTTTPFNWIRFNNKFFGYVVQIHHRHRHRLWGRSRSRSLTTTLITNCYKSARTADLLFRSFPFPMNACVYRTSSLRRPYKN